MEVSIKCGWRLSRLSLFYRYYAYIDSKSNVCERLLNKHKIRIRACGQYRSKESQYIMIICKVRKKDDMKFLDVLEELPNTMLICGYPDYPEFCEGIVKGLMEAEPGKMEPTRVTA